LYEDMATPRSGGEDAGKGHEAAQVAASCPF